MYRIILRSRSIGFNGSVCGDRNRTGGIRVGVVDTRFLDIQDIIAGLGAEILDRDVATIRLSRQIQVGTQLSDCGCDGLIRVGDGQIQSGKCAESRNKAVGI